MANVMKFQGDGVRLPILSSDPSSPIDGQMWYNTTDGKFKLRENGATQQIDPTNLTANRALISDGSGEITTSSITSTELGQLSGVTSNVQNQLDSLLPKDGSESMTGNLDMNSNKITGLPTPTADGDATSKTYVDGVAQGLDIKAFVKAATDSALPANTASGSGVGKTLTADANGALSVDGISTFTDIDNDGGVNDPLADPSTQASRVLVKNESTGSNNGLYAVKDKGSGTTPWILVRATDADEDAEVTAGMFTFVSEGTVNADKGFVLSTTGTITVDTTSLSFTQFSSAGTVSAGSGLTKSGDQINVGDVDRGVQANADSLEIDASEIASNGLKQNATNSWQLDIEPADFAGAGLQDDGSDNLEVVADTSTTATTSANAIAVDSNGVRIKVDDSTLEGSAQGSASTENLRVKAGGIGNNELATGLDAAKLADGTVSNTEFQRLDGVSSDIQPQLDGKAATDLSNLASTAVNTDIISDTDNTDSLGSATVNWANVHSRALKSNTTLLLEANTGSSNLDVTSDKLRRSKDGSNFVEEEYLDSLTLSDGTTTSPTELQFDSANFNAIEVEYLIREATSLNTRVGKLLVVTDGTNASITDQLTEEGDPGITWDASVSTGTVSLTATATSTGNTRTMRADVKRYRNI